MSDAQLPPPTNCFVSYKREDQQRVAPLVEALRDAGLHVWWDRELQGGDPWRQVIAAHLDPARCVIVCWTANSVAPAGAWVHEEAERAKARGNFLPVRLERVAPPFGFGEIQALDLIGWKGDAEDPRLEHVVASARAMVEGKPRPPPPPIRIPPFTLGAAAAALATLVAFASHAHDVASYLCRPQLARGVCRALALPGVPSTEEEQLWSALRAQPSCDSYRTYLGRYPGGHYAQLAQSALDARRMDSEERWTPRSQPLTVYVSETTATEADARAAIEARSRSQADTACAAFQGSDMHRVKSVGLSSDAVRCATSAAGTHCVFEGQAICKLEERSTSEREVCP